MIVVDKQTGTCKIYAIKYSKKIVAEQYKHLIDEQKCKQVERNFGKIVDKYVIYRGENTSTNEVLYLNVETYLKSLTLS